MSTKVVNCPLVYFNDALMPLVNIGIYSKNLRDFWFGCDTGLALLFVGEVQSGTPFAVCGNPAPGVDGRKNLLFERENHDLDHRKNDSCSF